LSILSVWGYSLFKPPKTIEYFQFMRILVFFSSNTYWVFWVYEDIRYFSLQKLLSILSLWVYTFFFLQKPLSILSLWGYSLFKPPKTIEYFKFLRIFVFFSSKNNWVFWVNEDIRYFSLQKPLSIFCFEDIGLFA
jgi:hypothetical protein